MWGWVDLRICALHKTHLEQPLRYTVEGILHPKGLFGRRAFNPRNVLAEERGVHSCFFGNRSNFHSLKRFGAK